MEFNGLNILQKTRIAACNPATHIYRRLSGRVEFVAAPVSADRSSTLRDTNGKIIDSAVSLEKIDT